MVLGPGKYDDLCTEAREKSGGLGAILIILEGEKGFGFSVQIPIHLMSLLPELLRDMADTIEKDRCQHLMSN